MLCSQNGELVRGLVRTKEDLVHSLQGPSSQDAVAPLCPLIQSTVSTSGKTLGRSTLYSIHFAIFYKADVVECIEEIAYSMGQPTLNTVYSNNHTQWFILGP